VTTGTVIAAVVFVDLTEAGAVELLLAEATEVPLGLGAVSFAKNRYAPPKPAAIATADTLTTINDFSRLFMTINLTIVPENWLKSCHYLVILTGIDIIEAATRQNTKGV